MTANLDNFLHLLDDDFKKAITHGRVCISAKILSDKQIILLAQNLKSSEDFSEIIKIFYLDSKERPLGPNLFDHLIPIVENSNNNLHDWLTAILHFKKWLASENRDSSVIKMIGFLCCCEESSENKNSPKNLISLLDTMLEIHGYTG